jgi:hypothetical protein
MLGHDRPEVLGRSSIPIPATDDVDGVAAASQSFSL